MASSRSSTKSSRGRQCKHERRERDPKGPVRRLPRAHRPHGLRRRGGARPSSVPPAKRQADAAHARGPSAGARANSQPDTRRGTGQGAPLAGLSRRSPRAKTEADRIRRVRRRRGPGPGPRLVAAKPLAEPGVDRTYVGRMLRLTSLAPDIIEPILWGDEPEGISLEKLRENLPMKLGGTAGAVGLIGNLVSPRRAAVPGGRGVYVYSTSGTVVRQ